MSAGLRRAIQLELDAAEQAVASHELGVAFGHLERAHVLGQALVVPHVKSHLGMLRVGWLRRDLKEVLGQLLRVPGAALGSWLGHVPLGNTGGANVSPFRAMPIPEDLAEILRRG